jgi:hypothetical protein
MAVMATHGHGVRKAVFRSAGCIGFDGGSDAGCPATAPTLRSASAFFNASRI